MRIDTLTGGMVLTALVLAAAPAAAQNNPFVPPQGGISKAQVQAIIRAELAREAQNGGGASAGPGGPGAPAGGVAGQMKGGPAGPPGPGGSRAAAAINGLQAAQGSPNGVSTASKDGKGGPGGAGGDSDDPVSQLITGGGQFVGCVSATPVFKDKDGRRAYFTTKELKASNEAKRIARCG